MLKIHLDRMFVIDGLDQEDITGYNFGSLCEKNVALFISDFHMRDFLLYAYSDYVKLRSNPDMAYVCSQGIYFTLHHSPRWTLTTTLDPQRRLLLCVHNFGLNLYHTNIFLFRHLFTNEIVLLQNVGYENCHKSFYSKEYRRNK